MKIVAASSPVTPTKCEWQFLAYPGRCFPVFSSVVRRIPGCRAKDRAHPTFPATVTESVSQGDPMKGSCVPGNAPTPNSLSLLTCVLSCTLKVKYLPSKV